MEQSVEMASYVSYGFSVEENEPNTAEPDQSTFSKNRKECERQAYNSTLFPTNSTTWLGVSRKDPRLKLAKYREYIISKVQGAGDNCLSGSYSDRPRVPSQTQTGNNLQEKGNPKRNETITKAKFSKKRTRSHCISCSELNVKRKAFKISSENSSDVENECKHLLPAHHANEVSMETTTTPTMSGSTNGHCLKLSYSDIFLPTVSAANLRLVTKENGGINILGKGVYGYVIRGRLEDNGIQHDVVAKIFKEDKNSDKDVHDEARILHYLWDTGTVPRVYGVVNSEELSSLPILVQECFGNGQDLYGLLESSPPRDVWVKACISAAEALEKIHAKGVLLNDIKPDNILINDNLNIRFIDMGMATLHESFVYPTGPLLFKCRHLAPEVQRGEPTRITSDIFSFGIVLQTIGKDGNVPDLLALSKLLISPDPILRCSLRQLITLLKSLDCDSLMEFCSTY